MTAIRILPDLLANKIAAGEVVERPASVVKELVENALDAGSSRILIEIEKGGRSLIQVADNGSGMGHDDALLCLERFATSKLYDDAGLAAITTLGFRGEALPSIAAVSHMTLTTRRQADDVGIQVAIQGGKISTVKETGAPPGTLIRVQRLFFNTPVRRKFLKSMATEMAHIADTVSGMALGHAGVHFKLTHNGKTVHQWPGTGDAGQRAAQVLGQSTGPQLIAVDVHQRDIIVKGYISPQQLGRTTNRGTYIFVNGRRVRDRVVQHALTEGYHGRLMKGRFPLAVLFIQLPYDQVDVNVHPTKHEIRFADSRAVHTTIHNGVAAALSRHERGLWAVQSDEGAEPVSTVAQPTPRYEFKPGPLPRQNRDLFEAKGEWEAHGPGSQEASAQKPMTSDYAPLAVDQQQGLSPVPPAVTPRFSDLEVIGQFSGTYIICSAGRDLILIDQHAAHERIVYEALKKSEGRVPSQQLLLPATVELGFAEARAMEKLLPELSQLGLEIEPFGGTAFSVRAVPDVLDPGHIESIVVALAEQHAQTGSPGGLQDILDQCRMVMACHKSVRANQRLTTEEIRTLLAKLDLCADPGHCPHGRPTWIRWSSHALAKQFGRLG